MSLFARHGCWVAVALLTMLSTMEVSGQGPAPNPNGQVGGVRPQQPTQQQPVRRQPVPGQAANQRPLPAQPGPLKAPFVLDPKQAQYVQTLLQYWATQSGKMTRYRCEFTRFEYDAVFGPPRDARNNMPAKTISYGKLVYGQPDKGLFQVNKVTHYQAPAGAGTPPTYTIQEGEVGEHWACNGQVIYELNHQKKELIEYQLPPDAQGANIVDGPLPFMFGADAQRINDRYWVRVITPREAAAKNEYWLEAWPKRRSDSSSFKMVHIILDKTFLPKAIRVFPPNYDQKQNPSNTTFVFDKREQNWPIIAQKLKFWQQQNFFEPPLPRGYKKVEQALPGAGVARNAPNPRQAVVPASGQIPVRTQ